MSKLLIGVFTLLTMCGSAFGASPVSITILHTNDLHAHFRPEKTPLALGGIARIKTVVNRLRAKIPNTVFVDGGDWSEGDIYYTLGAGSEILKMMNLMGYDVTVVGNHDWLNGPDTLLDAIRAANPRFSMVVANFDTSAYPRAAEWNQRIKPYVIRNIHGAKVAFIGLATYEFIYDKYIAPIQIEEPFGITHDLAQQLKQSGAADAVVVISHNRISYNQALLKAAPDVDLVIGAHDHVKLTKPVVVTRAGAAPAWIVETGCWGKYLGRVDMQVTPASDGAPSRVKLLNYGLIQMDRSVPEDPTINARLNTLERAIENRMGPVFTDHIGDARVELSRNQNESRMGNFTADAYRAATGADIALDIKNFVYGQIHEGPINSVDVYNSNPAIYNPNTGKSWTLKTVPVSGMTLSWFLNILLSKKLPLSGAAYTSGISVVFDGAPKPPNPTDMGNVPTDSFASFLAPFGSDGPFPNDLSPVDSDGTIQQVLIDGEPLDPDKTYVMTGSGGLFESIAVIDSLFPSLVPTDGMQDTGIEAWRSMADYVKEITPITAENVPIDARLQTVQPDLGIYYDDVNWVPTRINGSRVTAKISVQVHNFGATPSSDGPYLMIARNRHGNDLSTDAVYQPLAESVPIAPLQPGESRTYDFVTTLTADRGVYSVTAMIRGNGDESDHSNDDVLRYFTAPSRVR